MESVIKRMGFKVHFLLNYNKKKNKKEAKFVSFGFKSKHKLGQLKELDNFQINLFNIVTSLKFKKLNDSFKKK